MREGEPSFFYSGSELEIFAHAQNWKRYVAQEVQPYLGMKVLEVGAGMGSFTTHLCSGNEQQWLCLEPDMALAENIKKKLKKDFFHLVAKFLSERLRNYQHLSYSIVFSIWTSLNISMTTNLKFKQPLNTSLKRVI